MTDEEVLQNLQSMDIEEEPEPEYTVGPKFGGAEWQDYVFGKLIEGTELIVEDGKKLPTGNGLRRVIEDLLGPIMLSEATVVQPPKIMSTETGLTRLLPVNDARENQIALTDVTTVSWTLVVNRLHVGLGQQRITEVACVYYNNIDPFFLVHPVECAASKAEARALRKMLKLNCITRDEKMPDPYTEGEVTSTMITSMKVLCEQMKLDFPKVIKALAPKYASADKLGSMPKVLGHKVMKSLNEWRADNSKIPQQVR